MIISRRITWVGHAAFMGKTENAYRTWKGRSHSGELAIDRTVTLN